MNRLTSSPSTELSLKLLPLCLAPRTKPSPRWRVDRGRGLLSVPAAAEEVVEVAAEEVAEEGEVEEEGRGGRGGRRKKEEEDF